MSIHNIHFHDKIENNIHLLFSILSPQKKKKNKKKLKISINICFLEHLEEFPRTKT